MESIKLGFWCEKRDLNPYGKTTRPSNVRVCQFRHSRICHRRYCTRNNIYYTHFIKFVNTFLKNS